MNQFDFESIDHNAWISCVINDDKFRTGFVKKETSGKFTVCWQASAFTVKTVELTESFKEKILERTESFSSYNSNPTIGKHFQDFISLWLIDTPKGFKFFYGKGMLGCLRLFDYETDEEIKDVLYPCQLRDAIFLGAAPVFNNSIGGLLPNPLDKNQHSILYAIKQNVYHHGVRPTIMRFDLSDVIPSGMRKHTSYMEIKGLKYLHEFTEALLKLKFSI